jgi:hypothetical protein
MPQQFKSTKLGKGVTIVLYSHKMMALQWMDRKTVTLLSMCHDDVAMDNTEKNKQENQHASHQA